MSAKRKTPAKKKQAPIGRAALEREEKAKVEEVASLVRAEAQLEARIAELRRERERAVGALITVRRILGKPPTGDVDAAP